MLIVFEGIDGSGKNTQVRKLLSFFRQNGVRHRLHKYPTKKAAEAFTHLSGKKDVPASKLAAIFAEDILAEKAAIEREIAAGFVVVCDRYLHSTLAYQGVKMDFRGLKLKLENMGAVVPDVVFLLDIDPAMSAERKSAQKTPDRFEKDIAFLSKVRANYLRMAGMNFLSYKYAIVDATDAPDRVFTHIITQVEPILTKKMGK